MYPQWIYYPVPFSMSSLPDTGIWVGQRVMQFAYGIEARLSARWRVEAEGSCILQVGANILLDRLYFRYQRFVYSRPGGPYDAPLVGIELPEADQAAAVEYGMRP